MIAGVLLTAAGPAQADTVTWKLAPCVTAAQMEPSPSEYSGYVVLEGSATQCGPVIASGGFAIADYAANATTGTVRGHNVRFFRSTVVGEVLPFRVAALPLTPGEYGVCVLAGRNQRVRCSHVVVTTDSGDVTAVVRPLATDAPLVNKEVVKPLYIPGIEDPNPACGTCF
ncbi:hypothetical protein DMB66_35675 [Actinoplanes sp. ATCC 53533]|nr:hypothetical protein DMB66_35675 [Actinoplanes sp. ATCC 53533]